MKLCIGQIHRNFLIIRQFSSFSSSSSSINNVNINAKERSAVGEGRGARISPGTLDYRAVFLGSDHFSLASLIALTDLLPQGNVSVVVSNESNVVGKWARRNSLEMFLWKDFKSKEFQYPADTGGDRKYDFGVVASFGFLIPSAVIQRFPMGILNVHGSLLPRWRGAAPIAHAIINGDDKTGISIMKIAPFRFDVGPVLYQVEIPLHPHVRAPELTSIMAKVGADALSHVISNLHQFSSNSITQDESKALPSPKLTPDMADVDWSTSSPLQVYNLFRGLYGAFRLRTSFCGKLVNLDEVGLIVSTSKTQIVEKHLERSERTHNLDTDFTDFYSYPVTELRSDLPKDAQPGRIVFSKDILCVRCSDKNGSSGEPCWIFIRKVRIGTKWMNAKDFQNGFLSKLKVSDHCFRFTPTQSNAEGGDDNLQCKNSNKVQNT